MSRVHFYRPIQDIAGNQVYDATVLVRDPGTTTAIAETLYTSDTGTTTLVNPFQASDGLVDFYLDASKLVSFTISRPGQADVLIEDIQVGVPAYIDEDVLVFSTGQALAPMTGEGTFYAPFNYSLGEIRASVGTAPSGADIILDVKVNGTSIYSDPSQRPTIPNGGTTGVGGTATITALVPGDVLSIDIDQVGSTTPGSDLTVQIVVSREV